MSSAHEITTALQKSESETPGEALNESVLHTAYKQLAERFDEQHGGFGSAPKFPTPHNLLFLLRYWRRTGNEKALQIVDRTLFAMRQGGIYDHIGLGFHRYSTDSQWLVPHFEKMLYDQALLATAYTEAYQATGREEYAQTAHEVFTYVLRDMTAPEGGFYSAEDADSEGEEGKFYLWTIDEIYSIPEHNAYLPKIRKYARYLWPSVLTKELEMGIEYVVISEYRQDKTYSSTYEQDYKYLFRDFNEFLVYIAKLVTVGAINGANDALGRIYQAFLKQEELPTIRRRPRRLKLLN